MSQNGGPLSAAAAESQRLYAAADALGLSIAGRVADWDRNQELDRQAFTDAAAIGLTGIEVPKYLGGLGLGFRQKVQAAEIIGRHSMAYAFSVVNTQNVAARVAEIGSASHKRDLLPELLAGRRVGSTALTEPQAGSDFGAITTHAQRQGNQWLLNGEKAWITNASVSDVIICYAQTDPDAGSKGIASFLIDGRRSGFHRLAPYRLNGSHLIGTGGFRLENYRAEADDLLTEPGEGFRTALAGVNGARVYVAALCCAMVHAALVTATEYGAARTTFGRALLEHQGLAWSLASVANKLEAARMLTDRAIELIDRGDTDEIILAAAHAKKFATEMAEPAIIACIQAMGAEGLRDHHPLGRHLADARVANFVDGSTEIQTERIARSLTRVYQHRTFEPPPPVTAAQPPPPEMIGAEPPPPPAPTADDMPPPPSPATAWGPPEQPAFADADAEGNDEPAFPFEDTTTTEPPPPPSSPPPLSPPPPLTASQPLTTSQPPPTPMDVDLGQERRAGGWFDSPDLDTTELAEPLDGQNTAFAEPGRITDPDVDDAGGFIEESAQDSDVSPTGELDEVSAVDAAGAVADGLGDGAVEEIIDAAPPMPPGAPPLPPDSLRTDPR